MSGGGTGRLGLGGGGAAVAARPAMRGGGTLAAESTLAAPPAAASSLRAPRAAGPRPAASGSERGCSRLPAMLTQTSGMA